MGAYEEEVNKAAANKFAEVIADPKIAEYTFKVIAEVMARADYKPSDLYIQGWIDGTRYAIFQFDQATSLVPPGTFSNALKALKETDK